MKMCDRATKDEVEAMYVAAETVGRYPLRDSMLILIGYRPGLRVSEIG